MPRLSFLLVLVFLFALIAEAKADTDPSYRQPDLLSLGVNYSDFDKTESHKQSADFRGEYRFGWSFLSWEDIIQFHPMLGIELTTWDQLYAVGGYAMDLLIGRHFVFTWSEGIGLFNQGEARPLGSVVEFRSMGEIGYRFNNQMRFTLEASHISNASLTRVNPGEEIAGFYIHIPIQLMEKKQ